MNNNDIFRRLRYIYNFNDDTMMELFRLGGRETTRAEISDWLKRDDDEAFKPVNDHQLAVFLNGLIVKKRGKKDGEQMIAEKKILHRMAVRSTSMQISAVLVTLAM